MHYTGMAAIRLQPAISYDLTLFGASAAIAVAASHAALRIAFRTRRLSGVAALVPRIGAALIMGAAICGMHYTGMAAAEFAPGSVCIVTPRGVDPRWLAALVGGGSFLILAVALVAALFDARLGHNTRLAELLSATNRELKVRAEAAASWRRAASSASRRCCAGNFPSAVSRAPGHSSRLPRRPVPSSRSANGCCGPPVTSSLHSIRRVFVH